MIDLLISEFRRFRRLSLLAAGLHMLLLLFFYRTSDLLQQSFTESLPLFALYLAVGLLLALVQVGAYRKPSQWLWLMHRPLAPARVFAALSGSALLLLCVSLLLPQLLLVAGLDLLTTRVVDVRHYLAPVHLLAFAMMAWMAGCHAVLSPHRVAVAVIALPLLLALHLASVWWLLVPVLLSLGWLSLIALYSFRADRNAPLRTTSALLLTAIPLQLGFFLLVFHLTQMGFVTAGIVLGTDPLNTADPPAGGLIETGRKSPAQVLSLGLAHSPDSRAESWRQQLPLLEPVGIGAHLSRYPVRHQFGNLRLPTQWFDERRGILWTFSHDHMLFAGRDPKSGVDHGWWGPEGAGDTRPFSEVAIARPEGHVMTPGTLYAIDEHEQTLHALVRLDENERFVAEPEWQLDRLLVMTDRRLIALRRERNADPLAPPRIDWQIPLPAGPISLERVVTARLMDGWLVSFVYGDGHRQIGFSQFNTIAQPWQQVLFVDAEGNHQVVGERKIDRDYPAFVQMPWWLSPLMHALSEWPESVMDKGLSWPLRPVIAPDSTQLHWLAGALMLISLAAGHVWTRGGRMSRSRRRVWLISCALAGLPALLSLFCLEPRPQPAPRA